MRGHLSLVCAIFLLTSFTSFGKEEFQHPGGIYLLPLEKKSSIPPIVRYGIKEAAVLEYDKEWVALIGISIHQLPGEYLVYYRHSAKDEVANFMKFNVRARKTVTSEVAERMFPPEIEQLSALDFENTAPPKVPLSLPFQSAWTDEFGISRSNRSNRINAVDYLYTLISERSLIRAPQSGFVSNITNSDDGTQSIVIDHGQGLYSLIHGLSDLTVEVGNGVTNRAVIGKVATPVQSESKDGDNETQLGRISWQVQLNGVFVNPNYLTQLNAN